jgi:hypothetical protein
MPKAETLKGMRKPGNTSTVDGSLYLPRRNAGSDINMGGAEMDN